MRKCLSANLHILICIVGILLAGCGAKQTEAILETPNDSQTAATSAPPVFVDPDSVLSVIPGDASGLIYIRNPLALNEEINSLLAELVPGPGEPPQEAIASILADTFGAGFESLEELEELGLDLGKDFCVFFAGSKPFVPCAAAQLKDPEAIKQVIDAESEIGDTVEYNGITYNTTQEGGAFVILGDFMVYSGIPAVCEKAIDTHKKAFPSIGMNADYASLELDPSLERNDILAYFPMAPIVELLAETADETKGDLEEMQAEFEEMKADLEELEMSAPELQGLEMVANMMDFALQFLDQAKTLSVSVELDGADLQITPFLKFEEGSEAQSFFSAEPAELTHLEYLSPTAALNTMMNFEKEIWIDFTLEFMKIFAASDSDADDQEIDAITANFLEVLADYYGPLGEEASASFNFSGSLMPDMLFITDVVDEEQMTTYMKEDYLAYIEAAASLYKVMGAGEAADMYAGASAGPLEAYNGVDIMSYSFPNFAAAFSQMPPEMEASIPKQWDFYYAIENGKLLISMSATSQPIKDAVDRMAGSGTVPDETGHGKVIDTLTLKNNWMFTISPIALFKGVLQAVAQSDPQAGMIDMLLQNIPQVHSIGIAGQNRNGGVQAKIFIALADFKPLINMAMSMQQMMQMQEMPPMQ